MGADAVAVASAALIALACQQYKICGTGMCPMGIATQDPELRTRLQGDAAAQRVANFLNVSLEELKMFARITGHADLHELSVADLCTISRGNQRVYRHSPRLNRPTWNSDSLRSRTDRAAMGKYDRTEAQDMEIVRRVHTLAERYGVKMQQIALAWEWAKGVASPIIGATKAAHFDDAAGALSVKLRGEDIAYLEEPYLPHRIVGAIDRNPEEGVKLLDVKK